MKALAACPCEQFSRFPLGAIAPTPSNYFAAAHHCSNADLLAITRQVAQQTQPNEWETHRLEQYFGPESRSLPFKEMLLPLIWAARRQLIARVGARYHRLTGSQQAQRELELLVKLDTTLAETCQKTNKSKIVDVEINTEIVFQMALSGIFVQSSVIVLSLVEIASHWIDSTVELLDSL
ncbi:MAG: hypothetical protein F6K00_12415 [Leptolyngbya sp. SIOISBB]|nr:hypothetical protein [Leptolyngbya sp. SIOISBB]